MTTQTIGKIYSFTHPHVAVPPPSRSIELLARAGHVAKGVVYLTVGGLAVQGALGAGGRLTDAQGALRTIGEQPFGTAMLWAVAVGLFAYALWRIVQATLDPDHTLRRCEKKKSAARRIGYGISALAHLALALFAARIAMGDGGGGEGNVAMTARVMNLPFGQWLVGLGGLVVIGLGASQVVKAYKASFMREYDTAKMGEKERQVALRSGQMGLSARGVTFAIIGWFLIKAAIDHDPQQTHGLGDALKEVAAQPYGVWLLAIVAAGLVAYGLYCFSQARFRRFVNRAA